MKSRTPKLPNNLHNVHCYTINVQFTQTNAPNDFQIFGPIDPWWAWSVSHPAQLEFPRLVLVESRVWCDLGMLNDWYEGKTRNYFRSSDQMTDLCLSLNIIWLVVPAVVNQFIIVVVNETLWAMLGKIICRPLWWLTTSERWVIWDWSVPVTTSGHEGNMELDRYHHTRILFSLSSILRWIIIQIVTWPKTCTHVGKGRGLVWLFKWMCFSGQIWDEYLVDYNS